jgi:hypothetical protein
MYNFLFTLVLLNTVVHTSFFKGQHGPYIFFVVYVTQVGCVVYNDKSNALAVSDI